ncbi:substrate-binding domain-containing protein [Paenibacillus oenotherae]|uniref:Substrate-binding domain-containing protein n=1 Tax=Paenibacillus oenotherae TaxID=1435645 RepID=A0ABS7D5K6_9BACL|nr:substrate-binding domain-containing protein [Paenibacillus oenotherae]MBW7474756.1 substrate-binding domain-containing protein [Paenibacillus oenotherae]
MSRGWNIAIAVLFVLFSYLLLQFFFSTQHIRELVKPAGDNGIGNGSRHVVLIAQEVDNPYWRTIEQGVREAADNYGMDVEYTGPIRIHAAEQIRLLERAIAAKPDAIMVQGINDPQQRLLIDKAAVQGIPIITVDADEPDSHRLSYIGTDNLKAGKMMGELVAQAAAGTKGSIGVLIANEQSYSQQLRLAGFRSVLSRYPELTVVDVRPSNNSRLQATREAEEMLMQHAGKIDTMIGFSALDSIGILKAAEHVHPQRLSILAFDDLAETKAAIRQCRIRATIVQRPYAMGYGAITMLNDYFQGRKPEQQRFTEATVLTSGESGSDTGGSCP